jgi:glycerate-2-kinase
MWKKRRGAGVFLDALEAVLTVASPTGRMLSTSKEATEVAGRRYELSGAVHIVGFGKAPLKMAQAVVDVLGMP